LEITTEAEDKKQATTVDRR